ncbi:MAG: 50S ribosomal protein L5 [Candidatus Micrarchaeota archaeon]|nr:50S ribosomal protein L5 [Candidatus Micrarchaeota archaeon]
MDNKMREVRLEKLVVNIGSGSEQGPQENARKLLTLITGRNPANEISRTRNPSFHIAKGQKIGAYVTVRGDEAKKLLARLLGAVSNRIKESSITDNSVSFGIREYIDINGVKYDPKIGMLGMNVNMSFGRPGRRISLRKRARGRVSDGHRIVTKEEIKEYLKHNFKVESV